MLHTRSVHIGPLDSSGSASSTIGVPPSRYAGVYYALNPDTRTPDIDIDNLGRNVFHKAGTTNSDGVQELAEDAEKIVSGDVVVTLSGGAAGDEATINLFLHYPA